MKQFSLLLILLTGLPSAVGAQEAPTKAEKEQQKRDARVAELKKQLAKVRRSELKDLRARIKSGDSNAQLLFMLAESEWEEAQYIYDLAFEVYEKRLERFQEKNVGKKPKE